MNYIHRMDGTADSTMIGNKASRLLELVNAGFRVPKFFVIGPEAHQYSLDLQDGSGRNADIVHCAGDVREQITLMVSTLFGDNKLLAVRSSSADEDGKQNSFAGQFDSFLNIAHANVCQHVSAVWKSALSEHVMSYRQSQGMVGETSVPAVIVQAMIAADTAGVAFAADPVTGDRNYAVVAAGRGLGDSLVGGDQQGDTWRINERGDICKSELLDLADPVLTESQVRKLALLVREVSKFFGQPQDIEWAIRNGRTYLLQSRDITTLGNQAASESYGLWDNSNIVESYGGVTKPLTFSIARFAYADAYRYLGRVIGISERVIKANEKTYEQMIGLIDGRVYYNLLNWYRLLMLAPGFRFNRRFMEQMMGVTKSLPDAAVPKVTNAGRVAGLRGALGLSRVSFRLLMRLIGHNRRVRQFHRKLDRALTPDNLQQMTLEQLVCRYETLETQVIPAWDVPLINDLYCMIFHGTLRKLCELWLPEELADVHNNLVCGGVGMISLEPVQRMRKMANHVRGDEEFLALLNTGTTDSIRQSMAVRVEFQKEFDAYLERFGDRCMDELKLESRTLSADPLPMLRTVGQMAQTAHVGKAGRQNCRRDAEKEVLSVIRGGILRRFVFKRLLSLARQRVRDRENLRFERTRVYGRVRAIFVEIGKRLQAQNIIESSEDIFYLEVGEVKRFVQGTGASIALRGIIAARREEFNDYLARPNPPRRFLTHGPAQLAASRQSIELEGVAADEFSRKGQACSQGVVRGPVRIVRDPRLANIQTGEILVAERTDPGWVTIFPLVTGMIMERGSLLSHSAIVARELGLPCVVGVENACSWLRDGEWVEINGATGTIRRLAANEDVA